MSRLKREKGKSPTHLTFYDHLSLKLSLEYNIYICIRFLFRLWGESDKQKKNVKNY